MNYIDQINLLHRIRRKDSLKPTTVALHVILLDICNSNDWENPMHVKNDRIMVDLDVTFKTLAATRNRLQQSGLITFSPKGNGSSDCIYQILTPDESKLAREKFKRNQTLGKIPQVPPQVTPKVGNEVNAEVPPKVDDVYNTGIYKQKQKQNKERDARTDSLILEPGEIKKRLLENEYLLEEFICRNYGFSKENFSRAVEFFVDEKTCGPNELNVPYSDAITLFKRWVKFHREKLLKQFNPQNETSSMNRNIGNKKQTPLDILRINQLAKYGTGND